VNQRIKVVLIVSVITNILLAGMLLGDVSRRFMAPAPFDVAAQLDKLPQDKRVLFENILAPAKEQMDKDHAKMDDAKKEALRILKTEPFNAEAYLTQVRHIGDLHMQMKRHVAESVAELAKKLAPDERIILAEIISHPPFMMLPPAQPTK
jgi:uncharacterized membrane protein